MFVPPTSSPMYTDSFMVHTRRMGPGAGCAAASDLPIDRKSFMYNTLGFMCGESRLWNIF